VPSVSSEHLEVLAESKTGIEVIRHKSKKILATQFHPEKGGSVHLTGLIKSIAQSY
jgi:anthranilate/para-aminobenzoate synthase component II